jgi:DNA repair exonuclease SbcCD ATPase subunit
MNNDTKNIIFDLGNKLSNRVTSLQNDIEARSQQVNDLRSIMFQAATALRELDAEKHATVIAMLELPDRNCDGSGCGHAQLLERNLDEQAKQIRVLESQLYEYENVAMTLANQMGVNPFDEEDYKDSGCCPRIIPNSDE